MREESPEPERERKARGAAASQEEQKPSWLRRATDKLTEANDFIVKLLILLGTLATLIAYLLGAFTKAPAAKVETLDEPAFWAAVRTNTQQPAVADFIARGGAVDPSKLHSLLTDNNALITANIDAMLSYQGAMRQQFCITNLHDSGTSRFTEYTRDKKAVDFVKKYCAGFDYLAPLKQQASKERSANALIESQNAENRKCLMALDAGAKARFASTGTNCHAPTMQGVEKNFCWWLQGRVPKNQPEFTYKWDEQVASFCNSEHPPKRIDGTKEQQLMKSIRAYE